MMLEGGNGNRLLHIFQHGEERERERKSECGGLGECPA